MVGMKICIISMLLILISYSFSQPKKISGIVLDAKKQVPVEGANVFVSRVEIGTTSDADGYFKLLIDAKYKVDTLVISFLGYEDYRLPISGLISPLTIKLVPKILEMDHPITVTADIMDLAQREVAHSVHRIDVAEIERIGSSEISDLFKSIPSVRVEGNDLDGRTIQIRGSNPDEVNIYIDGILINNLRFDHVADLTLVPTESIEKLDVLKGGNLILLGNGAFGGVVNITTKKSFKNSYGLKVKGGSFDTKYLLANINLALTNNLNMNYFGQVNTAAPKIEFYQNERYSEKSVNNTIKSYKQNHHFNLNYFSAIGQYNTKFIGYFFDYKKFGWRNKYNNYILASSYRGSIFGAPDFEIAANYLIGDNSIDREQNNQQVHNSSYNSRRLNLRLAKAFTFSQTDFQFLSEYYHDELDNTSNIVSGDVSKAIYKSSIYENRIALAGVLTFRDTIETNRRVSWNTSIGVRYDILASGREDFTNTFGLQLDIPSGNWQIQPYGHYGKNIKYPTLLQNAFIRDMNDIFRDDTTTTRLEPEFNNTGEIGMNLKYQPLRAIYKSIDIVLALFHNTFYNKLLTRPFDDQISGAQQGRNVTKGVEFSIRMNQLWQYLSLSAYIIDMNISDPFLYPYKPDKNYSFQMDISALSGFYFHSAYFYEGKSIAWFYNQDNELETEEITPFFDIDVSAGYRFRVSRLLFNFQISGYNILDNSGYKYYSLKKRFLQASFSVKY
jgi:hypothetical protein